MHCKLFHAGVDFHHKQLQPDLCHFSALFDRTLHVEFFAEVILYILVALMQSETESSQKPLKTKKKNKI